MKDQTEPTMRKMNNSSRHPDILSSFLEFCSRRLLFVFTLFAVTAAVYGIWCSHDFISFDAEFIYNNSSAFSLYSAWIQMGRWGFYYFKKFLGLYLVNPYFSITMFLFCFPLSVLFWSFLFYIWNGRKLHTSSMVVFGVLYLTHPIWALQFAYRNQMDVCCIVMVLLPVGMYYLSVWLNENRLLYGILAFLFITFSFGCYQSFIFLYAEAVGIYFFFLIQNLSSEYPAKKRTFWLQVLKTLCFTAASYAAYSLISLFVQIRHGIPHGVSYLNDQFKWFSSPFSECVHNIASYLKMSFFGDGTAYSALYAVEVFIFIAYLVFIIVRKKSPAILSVLIGIFIILCPFALEFATAGTVVSRSQFSFVLTLAFLGMMEAEWILELSGNFSPKTAGVLIFILTVIAVMPQVQDLTRLLYTDVSVIDEDEKTMDAIYYAAMQKGAGAADAICLIGTQNLPHNDSLTADYEVIGFSYFEVTSPRMEKTIVMMNAMGYSFTAPTQEQYDAAGAEAAQMSVWPDADSVRVHDGTIIVRLS